jgi:DNA-binding XRE family transcriptional regulator
LNDPAIEAMVAMVPYVPTAADLKLHTERLIRHADLDRPVTEEELAWLTVTAIGLEEMALPNVMTHLGLTLVVELFRRGRATPTHCTAAHAAVAWCAQYWIAQEGLDRWAERRASVLDILERMTGEAARGTRSQQWEPETFGVRLYRLYRARGLTQRQLAEKVGTSASVIRKYESGGALPNLARVYELARVLEVSVTELLGQ